MQNWEPSTLSFKTRPHTSSLQAKLLFRRALIIAWRSSFEAATTCALTASRSLNHQTSELIKEWSRNVLDRMSQIRQIERHKTPKHTLEISARTSVGKADQFPKVACQHGLLASVCLSSFSINLRLAKTSLWHSSVEDGAKQFLLNLLFPQPLQIGSCSITERMQDSPALITMARASFASLSVTLGRMRSPSSFP